jgi:hypothetical protein
LRPTQIAVETAAESSRRPKYGESQEGTVHIAKDRILELLRESGDDQKASRAEQELADPVDTERDQETLGELGLDPKELVQKISGEGIPRLS